MASLNGIGYKATLVKAAKEHMAYGGMFEFVGKGEYYIWVEIYEKDPVHSYTGTYYPSRKLRFNLQAFAEKSLEEVLLSTGLFDDSEKQKLVKENASLKIENVALRKERDRLFEAYVRLKSHNFWTSYGSR